MAPATKFTRPPDRREQILDEAQRLFLEHGLENTTTRQIALAVGISQPSLYAHFTSRDAIAVEMCVRAFGSLERRLCAVNRSLAPSRRLRDLCRAYIDFGLEEPAAYRVAFMAEIAVDDQNGIHRGLEAGLATFSLLRDAMIAHVGAEEEAEIAAQSVWAGIHGLVAILLTRPEFPFVERNRLIEAHLERLLGNAAI